VKTPPDELLTVEEVADRLCIGKTKVYELMRRRELLSFLIDTCRRIPASEVAAFIARKLEAEHAKG
jgi:excisionase family DNA binding protein